MGLDMYFELRKEEWVSFSRWDAKNGEKDKTHYPKELKELAKSIKRQNFKSVSKETYYQVGYFRKFNALHNYIVNRFADGVDNCQRIFIPKNGLEEMLNVLKTVLIDKEQAKDILPTASGFFFGSTDYDEYYFEDVKEAIELFELILKTTDFSKYALIYNASW